MYYPSADIFPMPLASEDIIIFNWEQGDIQIGLNDKENGQIGVIIIQLTSFETIGPPALKL